MVDFEKPLETWNARFARDDYLFGEEPNAFLRKQANPNRGKDDTTITVT